MEGDFVFEIGPGRGALTRHIVGRSAAAIVAVEKDDYFSRDLLTNVFGIEGQGPIGNELAANSKETTLRVINDDVLNWMPLTSNDSKLFWTQFECTRSAQSRIGDSDVEGQRRKAIAIGNIPYNITKPLLQLILPRSDLFSEVILMLQLETANRIVSAMPGDTDYRAFSTYVHYYCREAEIISTVDRSAFNPRPRVDSAVVRFTLKDASTRPFYKSYIESTSIQRVSSHASEESYAYRSGKNAENIVERKFHAFVKLAFSNRRKMLKKTLSSASNYDVKTVEKALALSNLKVTVRPQELHVHDFVRLYQNILKVSK